MGRFHAVQLANDFAPRDRPRFLAIRRHCGQPVEKRAIEFLCPARPAWQGAPQCPYSTTHLKIGAALVFGGVTDGSSLLPTAGAHFFIQCDLIMMPETAEELSRQPDVRKELVRTTGQKRSEKVRAAAKDKFWLVTY